mmetsp:Transcript_6975/g.7981  ORF Transcript_6975/g.7981 Transcript_6975/m.7981 type:complete len:365 (-) Transcript_6975:50-1144(-)
MVKAKWKQIFPQKYSSSAAHEPCPRSSHGLSLARNGTCIILIGGEHIARTPLDSSQCTWMAEKSHESTASWKWRPICHVEEDLCPPARIGHSQAVINDKIFIFGGRQGIEMKEQALDDLWVLDCSGAIGTEAWSQVSTGAHKGPGPRSFHKMIAVGTDLYVFGGCGTGGRLADLYKFDTLQNKWEELGESLLRGRGGANLIHLPGKDGDGKLAVVAGFCGEESNDGHQYDLERGRQGWDPSLMDSSCLANLRPRSVCVSGTIPSLGKVVIFGGEVNPSDRGHEGAGGFENDIVVLDASTGVMDQSDGGILKQEPSASWPMNRGWTDGAVLDQEDKTCLYVFGGLAGDDSNPVRLGDLWECDFSQ